MNDYSIACRGILVVNADMSISTVITRRLLSNGFELSTDCTVQRCEARSHSVKNLFFFELLMK